MEVLKIIGEKPLNGEVEAAGAKNAVSKLLVASLISDKVCVFRNVPNISEVEITLDLCRDVGMEATWDKKEKKITCQTKKITKNEVSQKFSGANRIPILLIGALLGRVNEEIKVPTVGGDRLGKRPLNFHIDALEKLGAHVEFVNSNCDGSYYLASAKNGLTGAYIELKYPSVGATENTILAAMLAKGLTIIKNAAIEPEIIDLVLFFQKLGANIFVDTDRTIHIQSIEHFEEVEHWIIPDRNEIASYAMAAIATKGRVFIKNADHLNLITFLNKLRKIKAGFKVYNTGIEFFYDKKLEGGIHIETDVHPGFMTDWQQPFGVLLTQVDGLSIIHETVYEKRFGYIFTLREMGADVELFSQCLGGKKCRFNSKNHIHSVVVKGSTELIGREIVVPDLRAGFAYVMAALIAKGESTIYGVNYLNRGYEAIDEKLKSLGANILKKNLNK